MNEIKAMRVFAQIASQGSMTNAARKLGMANSVVSKNLNELEEWLGRKLLYRSTRNLHLTNEGETFLAECREILRRIDNLEKPVTDNSQILSGNIKVTAPVFIGRKLLVPVIDQFRRMYTDVAIDLIVDDDYRNMVDEGFDVALRVSELPDTSLIAKLLGKVTLKLVASPDYIASNGSPGSLKEINLHQCIVEGRGNHTLRWRFRSSSGRKISIIPTGSFKTNDPELILKMCRKGVGLAHLPDLYVDTLVADSSLVELLPEHRYDSLSIHLLYHHRSETNNIVKAFVDEVVKHVDLANTPVSK